MDIRVPDAEAGYLDAVVRVLRETLGDALTGVYPTGSLALDGYTPGRSDLDIVAAVTDDTPAAVLRTVAERLAHDTLPCPATGLEFVAYPEITLTSGSTEAGYLLDLNTGRALTPKVSLDPVESPRFWYVIDRSITRQSGRTLYGPAPEDLFRPVPFDQLLPVVEESVREHATGLIEHGDNAVLNGCRALRFATEQRWYAKPAAARWAVAAAPEYGPLIEAALASHAAGRDARHPPDPEQARTFLEHVHADISRRLTTEA